jgi:hypothetical protein
VVLFGAARDPGSPLHPPGGARQEPVLRHRVGLAPGCRGERQRIRTRLTTTSRPRCTDRFGGIRCISPSRAGRTIIVCSYPPPPGG